MNRDGDRAIDPAWLTELLAVRHADVEVTGVRVLDDSSGSANRLQLSLTYAPGRNPGLPDRMFLKRNLPRFSFPVEMYTTEVRVYREVLPASGIEAPEVYAIDVGDDDGEFTILMEDLSQRPGVRIGFVLDPTTPDEVDTVLDTLAGLHATYWGRPPRWASVPTADASMRFWQEVGPQLTRRHLQRGHRVGLIDQCRWSQEAMWGAFDALLSVDSSGPITFLHGDVHAGNVYYVRDARGGLLDWQLSLSGCWALDVSYLLTSALAVGDRRDHERDLLAGYLGRLRARGVTPPEDAWLRYRQNALYGVLMWLITPDGVHSDDAQVEYVRRCVTAAEDLETLVSLPA